MASMTSGLPRENERQELIREQAEKLFGIQKDDGHLVFELEADATIPAEYVLLLRFLGESNAKEEEGVRRYLLADQKENGAWPLFRGGAGDLSATVKAYWALKICGQDPESEPMLRARTWILGKGGAARANVFTRYSLALFGHIPWRGTPSLPVEVMRLPKWFPFHISKVAYWSRTVMIPLLVLVAKKARAKDCSVKIDELFVTPPHEERRWQTNPNGTAVGHVFLALDKILHAVEPTIPESLRGGAIREAEEFVVGHLNGEDGLGAIYPAMANAVMMMATLGYADDDPRMKIARKSIDLLKVWRGDQLYVQPCVSPVWDTALSSHALLEAGASNDPRLGAMLDWLASKQILDHRGDWTVRRPGVRPGGWAFQYENPDYPDVDDTAVVAMAMHRQGSERYAENIERACEWLEGMQSASGGWGAFEPENEHFYLNAIPFADHGALLDPPTVDVTARCIGCLAQVDPERYKSAIEKGLDYLKSEQLPDGSWFGRWGANYIYGTWSVLVCLEQAGVDLREPWVRRAAQWLKTQQRPDGGFGEGLESYEEPGRGDIVHSNPSQTAWAMMGLMAAGEVRSDEVAKASAFLQNAPREEDSPRWAEGLYTGTGFPRVFYLKYHGYAAFFPLWAQARYERMSKANDPRQGWGM
ncbi:squalene--hopene cyclase [Parvularcula sp. ZS-1/3]|uniref:Squalene--hopene cyclase n=1 Tax=Parvularcula mediterranea TaxID=2732508 RepID=A0A7Y3W4F7_9PROT|nr:squalene--hopene cyclase [Parvularcula mediterranea]NNU15695.1 squalene--hopene cyclase [Parvularcula mediterranea]